MNNINISLRTDKELKRKAEEILNEFGMTINGSVNMFLKQIVREKAIPLNLSLNNTTDSLYSDLLLSEDERNNGYNGTNSADVLKKMDDIIKAKS